MALTKTVAMLGNTALLGLPDKVAFLASRKLSAATVLKCYEWAARIRDGERCIIGGFQSPVERDVLLYLLRGKVPIVWVLARRLWRTPPREILPAVEAGRLLVVSPFDDKRVSVATARARNQYVLAHCAEAVIGVLSEGGGLAEALAAFPALPVTVLAK